MAWMKHNVPLLFQWDNSLATSFIYIFRIIIFLSSIQTPVQIPWALHGLLDSRNFDNKMSWKTMERLRNLDYTNLEIAGRSYT